MQDCLDRGGDASGCDQVDQADLVAPKTNLTFYAFAIGLDLTWLATVPPTAGLVGKLFGLTLPPHQTGAFFGAWLGGPALVVFGNFDWMWCADIALAAFAGLISLLIREEDPRRGGGGVAQGMALWFRGLVRLRRA